MTASAADLIRLDERLAKLSDDIADRLAGLSMTCAADELLGAADVIARLERLLIVQIG